LSDLRCYAGHPSRLQIFDLKGAIAAELKTAACSLQRTARCTGAVGHLAASCRAMYSEHLRGARQDMARIKIFLVLNSGARVGPGKAALLESVRDTGSISATAARAMGMDYKRAWIADRQPQSYLRGTSSVADHGGTGGGGATLTSFGAEVLERTARTGGGSKTWWG
jgi:molybdate transport system regulatory protein